MVNLLSKSLAIAVPYALMSQSITALDLKGTVYETAGRHYQIDPLLLYSISIAESGKSSASGFVKPTPLVIRTPEGPIFFNDLPHAVGTLRDQRSRFESIDVGLMQINIKYHPKADPVRLFDPNYSVHYAASYLRTCLDSTQRSNRGELAATTIGKRPAAAGTASECGESTRASRTPINSSNE